MIKYSFITPDCRDRVSTLKQTNIEYKMPLVSSTQPVLK